MSQNVFVELFAGTAAVSMYLLGGQKPLISRLGSKAGYAAAIVREMELPEPDRLVWSDTDPGLVGLLRLLAGPQGDRDEASRRIADMEQGKETWLQAKREAAIEPVSWLVWAAGARGGVGGFKGAHVLRPSVAGFIPSLPSLARRLSDVRVDIPVDVILGEARSVSPIPGSWVYLDPPYVGRSGYPHDVPADVLAIGRAWFDAGCKVAISEAMPLPGRRSVNISADRVGQRRRSLTRDDSEWLTLL